VKKRFDIISGPGLVLLVIKSNSFKISVRLIWHECKLTSVELFEEGDDVWYVEDGVLKLLLYTLEK